MSAKATPEEARAALRERARTAVELLRRKPQLNRLLVLSYVVAPSEQMLRHIQRAQARAEAKPAT
jgi:hypothetical protein